ncbi:MAG TPA: transporter [Thermoanaerobaculia bacterium]
MRCRAGLTLLVLVLFSRAAGAQITIQHGDTLSALINNLYGGNGIQLKDTGHQAHFGESQDFQNFSLTLQRVLQSHPLFPIPSAVGLVSYRFNEQTGTYERVQGSLGPLLADRGATTGKGTLTVSGTYSFSDFDRVNGADSIELVLHHCLLPQCVTNIASPYLQDTIHVNVHFRLKSQALTMSAVYGVTDRLDVGLVVPYLRNDLSVLTNAVIVPGPNSVPPDPHQFDLAVETPGQYATGSAIGIGDVVARGKMRIGSKTMPFDAAVLADVSLPTGDKENFLGTGEVRTKLSLVASKAIRSLTPHVNLGYEANWGESNLNAIDYRVGSEYAPRDTLTISGEVLGVVRPNAAKFFTTTALEGQSLIGRSEIDGAIGGKWQMSKNRALLFNLLVPMNDRGIRASSVVTVGIQGTL